MTSKCSIPKKILESDHETRHFLRPERDLLAGGGHERPLRVTPGRQSIHLTDGNLTKAGTLPVDNLRRPWCRQAASLAAAAAIAESRAGAMPRARRREVEAVHNKTSTTRQVEIQKNPKLATTRRRVTYTRKRQLRHHQSENSSRKRYEAIIQTERNQKTTATKNLPLSLFYFHKHISFTKPPHTEIYFMKHQLEERFNLSLDSFLSCLELSHDHLTRHAQLYPLTFNSLCVKGYSKTWPSIFSYSPKAGPEIWSNAHHVLKLRATRIQRYPKHGNW